MDGTFDLSGTLRRIRRLADLSQRQLAAAAAISPSTIARAEAGTHDLPVAALARAAALAGLRVALLDRSGEEIAPMSAGAVRDHGGRRFPAHFDTRHSDEGPGLYEPRRDRPEPWFTYTRDRDFRDAHRRTAGAPEDHHEFRAGDSPQERKEQRRREAHRRADEERQRRITERGPAVVTEWSCTCPARCDELDDRNGRPVHADGCSCLCDVG